MGGFFLCGLMSVLGDIGFEEVFFFWCFFNWILRVYFVYLDVFIEFLFCDFVKVFVFDGDEDK